MQTLPVEQLTSFLREAKDSGVFALYYIDVYKRQDHTRKAEDHDLKGSQMTLQMEYGFYHRAHLPSNTAPDFGT